MRDTLKTLWIDIAKFALPVVIFGFGLYTEFESYTNKVDIMYSRLDLVEKNIAKIDERIIKLDSNAKLTGNYIIELKRGNINMKDDLKTIIRDTEKMEAEITKLEVNASKVNVVLDLMTKKKLK